MIRDRRALFYSLGDGLKYSGYYLDCSLIGVNDQNLKRKSSNILIYYWVSSLGVKGRFFIY